MFTIPEKRLIDPGYFHLVRETVEYLEIQSKSTFHLWIIKKNPSNQKVLLYHKHCFGNPYYHMQRPCSSVREAILSIKAHDTYVLNTIVSTNQL